jgi:hypothetical protein
LSVEDSGGNFERSASSAACADEAAWASTAALAAVSAETVGDGSARRGSLLTTESSTRYGTPVAARISSRTVSR